MINCRITPLTEQFSDPIYPVLLEEVPQGSKAVSAVVIFEHDRNKGKFDFGDLDKVISHWPTVALNTLKARIKEAVFDSLKDI